MVDEKTLPGGENLDWIFKQIAEKNDEEAIEAAMKIIKMGDDKGLRTDLIKMLTAYQTAKDSVAMHEAMEAVVAYVKRQYAVVGIQLFRMGQGYQQKIAAAGFKEILENAAKAQELEDQAKTEEEPGTESEK